MPTVIQLEKQIRERKQAVSMQFRLYEARKAGENANQRQVLNALKKAEDILQQLEGDHTALSALKDTQAGRDMVIGEWLDYFSEMDEKLYQGFQHHKQMPGAPQTPEPPAADVLLQAAKAKFAQRLEHIKNEIETFKTQLEEIPVDADPEAPPELTKVLWLAFNKRLEEIKLLISPGLEQLNDKMVSLDPAQAGAYHAALTGHYKAINVDYNAQLTAFSKRKVPDDTILAAADANSSALSSGTILAAGGDLQSVLQQTLYRHKGHSRLKPEEYPDFNGDVKDYPLWLREWKTEIIPYHDEAYIIRVWSKKHLKVKNPMVNAMISTMDTVAEAIKYLDSIWANSTVVSQQVINDFTNLSINDLPGSNAQQKLLALSIEVNNLYKRLQGVEQEFQLTNNLQVVSHAIDLIPSRFQDQFGQLRWEADSKAKDSHQQFSANDLYKLFQQFLNEKSAQFREYFPSTLVIKPAKKTVGVKGGVSSHYREALEMKRWPDDSEDTVEDRTLKGNHVELGKGAQNTASGRGAPLPQTEA